MVRGISIRPLVLAGVLLATQALLLAAPVAAAEIGSAGPLIRVIVSPELNCQVAHRDDSAFELFPSSSEVGSCGTFVALAGTVYGPSDGSPTGVPFIPVSQSAVTGSGGQGDPLRVVTVVELPATGVRIEQIDSYVVGSQSYRTQIALVNTSAQPQSGIVYRAGDCYLQESDHGFGRVDGGAPACIVDPAEGRRIEQWTPITPGSTYFEGSFGEVWTAIASQQLFPNTCRCDELIDNGAGLSWPVSIAPGQTVVVAHETFFSPVGRGPAQQSLRNSVSTQLILDPVVVVQSLAITAGVILLVPFPSALFNSTLEENYDEVMGGVRRIRARLVSLMRALMARLRSRTRPAIAGSGLSAGPLPSASAAPPAPPAPPARDIWRTPLGMLGFIIVTALLFTLLDPTLGLSVEALATWGGLALGLSLALVAYGLPIILLSRSNRFGLTMRALPATLLVGAVCVIVSRLADFQPGYLYGLIIGVFFAQGVSIAQEGRAEAVGAGMSLAVALAAWVTLGFLRAGAPANDPSAVLIEAATVTTVVAGLENAVFAMLPLRFLPGAAVYAWNRRVWVVLIGLGLFGFAHVLLNPTAGYLADSTRTSFVALIVLLVAFGLASVLFWGYFRFRPRPGTSA